MEEIFNSNCFGFHKSGSCGSVTQREQGEETFFFLWIEHNNLLPEDTEDRYLTDKLTIRTTDQLDGK